MLLSVVSMLFMMSLKEINYFGLVSAGLIMGMSFGLYWANRVYLVLATTTDKTRNFYYGLDTFFYTLTAVIVPVIIGWYCMNGNENTNAGINSGYKVVTGAVFVFTIIASIVFYFGNYEKPKNQNFLYLKFYKLWNKLLQMAFLKGLSQGFIVTASAILMMKFFASEGALGLTQSIGAIIAAVVMLLLGKITSPKHRLVLFSIGLILFFLASFFNSLMFNPTGVILFIFLLLIARPILDIAYFPIQLKVIEIIL